MITNESGWTSSLCSILSCYLALDYLNNIPCSFDPCKPGDAALLEIWFLNPLHRRSRTNNIVLEKLFQHLKMADPEKSVSFSATKLVQEKPGLSVNISSTSLDKAAVYLQDHGQLSGNGSVDGRTLLRKIDWRIMPLAFACYTAQFIDKVNINVCAPSPTVCDL